MFAKILKAVCSMGSAGKKRNDAIKRKEARLSLETLERRDTPSANTFERINSNVLPEKFVQMAATQDWYKYRSFTPGSQGLMDFGAVSHVAPQAKRYSYELYLSPDSNIDVKDRLLLTGPVEYGSSSSGTGKDISYYVDYGAAVWRPFRMPDAADAIYKQADRSVDGGDRHAQVWTSLRIVDRVTGENWWGGQQFHDVILGKVADEKPDIRINSAVMENNQLSISATLTGNVTKFQVSLFASSSSTYVKGDPNTAFQWNVNCSHNGAEGTYTFKVAIGGANGVRLPGAGNAGRPDDYFLFAVADANSQIVESDETNNVAAMTGWYMNGYDILVQGGAGNDSLKITADDVNKQVVFNMNGAAYNIKANGYTFNVRGHGGNDTVDVRFGNGSQRIVVSGFGGDGRNKMIISGSAGKDTATLHAVPSVRSSFLNSNYGAYFSNFADMEVYGGGGDDTVQLYDSAGDDTLEFRPATTTMSDYYRNYSMKAVNFNTVSADSLHAGRDYAKLYGSSSVANTFIADPRKATLSFVGQKATMNYFGAISAYGKAGGNDTAQLTGSDGYDEMLVDPKSVSLTGSTYQFAAIDFRNVTGFAGQGKGKATVVCTGNNTFVGKPDQSSLSGAGFTHYMNGFKEVEAYSRGNDTATFYGSDILDVFKADPASAELSKEGVYVTRAMGFRTVQAYAQGSFRAYLTASGGRDLLKASYIYANLTGLYQGASYSIYVKGFTEVVVDGKSSAEAYLYDSPNNDSLYAEPLKAYLQDDALSYQIIAKNFRRVRAVSQQGGNDRITRTSGDLSYLEPQGAWR